MLGIVQNRVFGSKRLSTVSALHSRKGPGSVGE